MSAISSTYRNSLIKGASLIGVIGNGLLAVLKLVAGFISGSAAVIADGIDSASDIITASITYFANKVSTKPPDKKHPWGYQRIEVIAAKIISYVIMFAGFQLIIGTVSRFFQSEASSEVPGMIALWVTLISILGKAIISAYQRFVANKTNSAMMKAEAANMKNDILLSITVLVGLSAIYLTHLMIIDTLLGIGFGIWIMRDGIKRSFEARSELMDSFEAQQEVYLKLFQIIAQNPEVQNPHKVRIRKINQEYDIIMDIEVAPNLTVTQGHNITRKLKHQIKKGLGNVFDVVIHVEPIGNVEKEQFGLCEKDFSYSI